MPESSVYLEASGHVQAEARDRGLDAQFMPESQAMCKLRLRIKTCIFLEASGQASAFGMSFSFPLARYVNAKI